MIKIPNVKVLLFYDFLTKTEALLPADELVHGL